MKLKPSLANPTPLVRNACDLCGTLHCSFVQLLSDVWAWTKCGGGDRFIKSNADFGGMHERESFFWFFSLIVCVLQTTQMHVVVRRDHVGVCVEILNLNWLLGMLCFEACSISGRNMAPWWTVGNKYIAGAGNPDAFTGVTSWQRWYVLGNPVRMMEGFIVWGDKRTCESQEYSCGEYFNHAPIKFDGCCIFLYFVYFGNSGLAEPIRTVTLAPTSACPVSSR